jgi:hypothetical protein|tara:strand:- start:513 stop:719 length:207 start_codon:yes stop_codon:yes gene_type:complete
MAEIDWSSKQGAEQIAARIKEYWRARGYTGLTTHLSCVNTRSKTIDHRWIWQVRSNIGPTGYPPRGKA